MKVVCKTNATATDGRSGISKLDDGSFEINSVPFGRKTEGVNPEQLFALRKSACIGRNAPGFEAQLAEA